MLNHKRFNEQREKLVLDIRRITARYYDRLKHLYHNPAEQIFRLEHSVTEPKFIIVGTPPADIAAEIWAAYELRFNYPLQQKQL